MALIKGTNVIAPIVPFDTADVHPSHEALYGRGGYRTVADQTQRDAIPAARREAGMLVFVESDSKVYRLGSNLTTWAEFAIEGPPGPQGDPATLPSTIDGNGTALAALLLHFDGANSSTAITDSSVDALTVTAHDGATISTAQSKFGVSSVYLPGSGSCLRITGDLAFGTGDFTVDAWLYMTGGGIYPSILEIGGHLNPTGLLLIVNSGGAAYSNGWYGTLDVPLNEWVHIAWVRESGVLTVYLNGTATGSSSFTNDLSDSTTITIGNKFGNDPNYDFTGWIDELRIVQGTALFTGAFTPPDAPYSGTAGTTMRQRRGSAAALAGVTLVSGQIAYESDTGKIKVGDGSTVYSSLAYVGGGGSSAWEDITGKPSFATVATSGAYADLTGKPTLFDGSYTSLTSVPGTFAPSAHKSSHSTGGADAIAAADIGAAAASHAHGNITNAGAIGSTSGLIVVTTTAGVLTTASSIASSAVTGLPTAGTGSTNYCAGSDSRLSDSREWSASTVSQADAEAGTATTRVAWTVLRVWQAIAAWWAASAMKTKLDGIAAGATANSSDATLLARANHTGTQAASTITGLGTLATQSGTFSGTSSGANTGDQTITITGDVTGSGTGSFAATLSSTGVSAGTYTSVTVDAKGRVTAGSSPTVAYSALSGVPSTFVPSAHTHPLSELSQSGATTNQVPQWNGTAWVPATVSSGSSSASDLTSGTLADARLSSKSQAAMNLYLWSNFR